MNKKGQSKNIQQKIRDANSSKHRISLPKITMNSILKNPPQRLQFPRRDDTSLFNGFGKKHYLVRNSQNPIKMTKEQLEQKLSQNGHKFIRINSEGPQKRKYSQQRINSPQTFHDQELKQKILTSKIIAKQRQNSQPSLKICKQRMPTQIIRKSEKNSYQQIINQVISQKTNMKDSLKQFAGYKYQNQHRMFNPTYLATKFYS